MLKKIIYIYNAYNDAKGQAIEESVNAIESDSTPWFGPIFIIAAAMLWGAALQPGFGLEALYNSFGLFYPAVAVFATTYFGAFLTSKLVIRPTIEERKDATSLFALFSACRRREFRCIFSIALATIHIVILAVYLASKDT